MRPPDRGHNRKSLPKWVMKVAPLFGMVSKKPPAKVIFFMLAWAGYRSVHMVEFPEIIVPETFKKKRGGGQRPLAVHSFGHITSPGLNSR